MTPEPATRTGAQDPGIGVVVPFDMALDKELWRWVPSDVTLFLTRTPYVSLEVGVAMATLIGDEEQVAASVRDLAAVSPVAYAYACTSASFVHGQAGERSLVAAMVRAGAPQAVTTSGAIMDALTELDVSRVAIATPYDQALTDLLGDFLREGGVDVVGSSQLGLTRDVWKVPYPDTARLARAADTAAAKAIVVSCTNLPTYDLIAPLEAELGKPVVTANQATIWAALRQTGQPATGPGQSLVQH